MENSIEKAERTEDASEISGLSDRNPMLAGVGSKVLGRCPRGAFYQVIGEVTPDQEKGLHQPS